MADHEITINDHGPDGWPDALRETAPGTYQVHTYTGQIGALNVGHLVEPGPLGVQDVVTSTVSGTIRVAGSAYRVGLTFQSLPDPGSPAVDVGGTVHRIGLPGGGPADVMQAISDLAARVVTLDRTPVRIAQGRVEAARQRMEDARVQAEIAVGTYHRYLNRWLSALSALVAAKEAGR